MGTAPPGRRADLKDRLSGASVYIRHLVAGVLPYECPGCGARGDSLVCGACRGNMAAIREPYCRTCGRPLPPGVQYKEDCRDCVEGSFHFDRCRSVFLYEPPVSGIVKRFKFRKNVHLGDFLCAAMAEIMEREPEMFGDFCGADAIAPVPLHPFRLVWRGFNQAEMLARGASKVLGVRVLKCLVRKRNTRPQSRLDVKQRAANVKGAFAVRGGVDVAGKRIIIVDDVMTTGATVNECSKVLLGAGAEEVFVLTAARRA